jgi:hypothetical protein
MALSIMNYSCTEDIPTGTVKAFYPIKPGTPVKPGGSVEPDTSDPDHGQSVIILEPVSRDAEGVYGSVRIITPNGVRVVESLSIGVWVYEHH